MMRVVKANSHDSMILARMNKHLIEDEGHRNPVSVEELNTRMSNWLTSDWEAVLIYEEDVRVGYSLYRWQTDAFNPKERFVYLRQFFVQRFRRRRGIGTRAFEAIQSSFWRGASRIEVEVLTNNQAGIAFWSSLGFRDYSLSMKKNLQ